MSYIQSTALEEATVSAPPLHHLW